VKASRRLNRRRDLSSDELPTTQQLQDLPAARHKQMSLCKWKWICEGYKSLSGEICIVRQAVKIEALVNIATHVEVDL